MLMRYGNDVTSEDAILAGRMRQGDLRCPFFWIAGPAREEPFAMLASKLRLRVCPAYFLIFKKKR